MFTIDEMEILKSALEGDMIRQKKFLDELEENFGSDVRFEMWYADTQMLYKKISNQLFDMKVKEQSK